MKDCSSLVNSTPIKNKNKIDSKSSMIFHAAFYFLFNLKLTKKYKYDMI